MYTLQEIHQSFDSFGEVLERKLETQKTKLKNAPKGVIRSKREKDLGFMDIPSIEKEKAQAKVKQLKKEKQWLTHYQQNYPQYKFITEKKVEKLCKKYGLLLANINKFKGEVPEFAIKAMEGVFLDKEDFDSPNESLRRIIETLRNMNLYKDAVKLEGGESIVNEPTKPDRQGKVKPLFKICATPNLLDTRGMKVRDGYKLEIEDPIVLAYVRGGYLVITKWGEEGKDESLTNEKMN